MQSIRKALVSLGICSVMFASAHAEPTIREFYVGMPLSFPKIQSGLGFAA
jgi:hypothetical protein